MKRRIFIEAHYLEIGGAEVSLIGLLKAIDYSRYDVDLFLYSHRGELMEFIPDNVRLLPEIAEYAMIEQPIKLAIRKGFWRLGTGRLLAKIKYAAWAGKNNPTTSEAYFQYLDNEIMPALPSLFDYGTYDLAINFIALRNHIPTKVNARKTISWIHTDYSSVPVNVDLELPAWDSYDVIASISEQASAAFIDRFPSLAHKVMVIENILSARYVRERARQSDAMHELVRYGGSVNLLSVGRFCTAKNYDNVPDICRRLVAHGIDVRWFIIGFGNDENLIREKITETGMESNVILLGQRTNPYPYIKACDIYVQPSRYEGKSVTVREAQILCKPVAVTRYATAESQINDGVDGIITPMDNEGCARRLADFIHDIGLQKHIIANLTAHDFGNETEVTKIYNLMPDL